MAEQTQELPFADAGALVIGGGRNIGRAIAREFARRGARLVIADLDADGAGEAAALIREAGGEAHGIGCDVTDDGSVAAAVAFAAERLGAIDILANNAGILNGGNPEDIPVAAWRKMMDVNFLGMARAIEASLPAMLARGGGHIVNTASFAGLYPYAASRIHYAASKAAVVSMSENLMLYLAPKGIRVSLLCPGPVMTTSTEGMTHFSADYAMRGPGAGLAVKSQEETAAILADGMRDGRFLIPTHDEAFATLVERAASPDAFLRAAVERFAAGDNGLPKAMSDDLRRRLEAAR